jgi:threonine dehydratase
VKARPGETVVAIVSGGNVDRAKFAQLIAPNVASAQPA